MGMCDAFNSLELRLEVDLFQDQMNQRPKPRSRRPWAGSLDPFNLYSCCVTGWWFDVVRRKVYLGARLFSRIDRLNSGGLPLVVAFVTFGSSTPAILGKDLLLSQSETCFDLKPQQ